MEEKLYFPDKILFDNANNLMQLKIKKNKQTVYTIEIQNIMLFLLNYLKYMCLNTSKSIKTIFDGVITVFVNVIM